MTHIKKQQDEILSRIQTFIDEHKLITPGMRIIVGLSGGPDSVFLLHALKQLQKDLSIELLAAHLDHEWRVQAADDADFCKQLTNKWDIPYVTQKRSALNFSFKYNGSREEEGRVMRRHFFNELCAHYKADRIALGHHLQDQQETFFLRLIRGSSLTGLSAMRPHAGQYIRPLLFVSKEDIVAYLTAVQIPFVIDQTNASNAFLRNRIRQQVLPALKACDDRFDQNFLKTVERLHETEAALENLMNDLFAQLSSEHDGKLHIHIDHLLAQPIHLQHRLVMQWLIKEGLKFPVSHQFLQELLRFLKQGQGTHQITHQWQIIKANGLARVNN